MGKRMGARAHQRHLAGQDPEKLRQLVKAGGAQEAPDAGDPGIALDRLHHIGAVFQDMHAAEFVDAEQFSGFTGAALAKQHRSA